MTGAGVLARRRASGDETLPAPWEADDYVGADTGAGQRHDAFTLAQAASIPEGAREDGMHFRCLPRGRHCRRARSTIFRHSDEEFCRHCTPRRRHGQRPGRAGRLGAGRHDYRGGCDSRRPGCRHAAQSVPIILRLLLQGSNPTKYGPRPGFSRKRLMQLERKQMAREIRAGDQAARRPTFEQVRDEILRKLDNIRQAT